MVSNKFLKIALIIGLIIIGAGAGFNMFRNLVMAFYSPIYLLGLLSTLSILYFCLLIGHALVHNKKISIFALIISAIAGLIAVTFVTFTALGVMRDLLGQHCYGIMGADIYCVTQPALTGLLIMIAIPYLIIWAGIVTFIGICDQYRQKLTIK